MTYRVIVQKRAQKEMRLLSAKDQRRVYDAIVALGSDPFVGKQLQGELDGLWAIRVWPYRIIYTVNKKIVTVTVLRVGHRQGVYRP